MTSDATESLDNLYLRGLGILNAMLAHVSSSHGQDERKRDAAEGSFVRLIARRWERLHEDYAAFAREQYAAEAAKLKKVEPIANGVKRA